MEHLEKRHGYRAGQYTNTHGKYARFVILAEILSTVTQNTAHMSRSKY